MRWVTRAAGVLVLTLGVTACTDDGAPDASAEASSRASTAASRSTAPADPTKLYCDGDYASAGVIDYAGPAMANGKLVYPPNSDTPESIAARFERSSTFRHILGWNLDAPPTRDIVRTDGKQRRTAHVYYRNPNGRTVAILDLSWSRGPGWLMGGTNACSYGPDEPRPTPSPFPTPEIVIDRTMFSPRVQREALALDCQGGESRAGVFDRRPNLKAKALKDPDAATDGLAAFARRQARRDPGWVAWEGSRPPSMVLLFPRTPADSMRAVIRLVTASGRPVVSYAVARDVARGPWIVESYRACA